MDVDTTETLQQQLVSCKGKIQQENRPSPFVEGRRCDRILTENKKIDIYLANKLKVKKYLDIDVTSTCPG